MKNKIGLTVLLFFLSLSVINGQHLEFGQPIFIELEGTTTSSTDVVVDSFVLNIPAGKTVKISSVGHGMERGTDGLLTTESGSHLFLNKKSLWYHGGGSTIPDPMPIWLPTGQYVFYLTGNGSSQLPIWRGYVSGIEFNIVP